MADRCRILVGAGVLAGSISATMLVGAGVALADDGSAPDNSPSATSPSHNGGSKPAPSRPTKRGPRSSSITDSSRSKTTPTQISDESADTADNGRHRALTGPTAKPANAGGTGRHRAPEKVDPVAEPTSDTDTGDQSGGSSTEVSITPAAERPTGERVATLTHTTLLTPAAAPSAKAIAPLSQAFGDVSTYVYNLFAAAAAAVAGPAHAPAGSKVTVTTSSLQIGGADGITVSADWYVPTGGGTPTHLIYLQHGFLATAAFYSATAANLAESTNSVVVAPTVTWNIFDPTGMALTLPALHEAVADLFVGNRGALNASARAAGLTVPLPRQVVLAGHSTGGGLAVGVARYMTENGSVGDLAGVVMFDGVGYQGNFAEDLAEIPDYVPVYDLAGSPYSWNDYGLAQSELQRERRGQFTGVQVLGGRHADAMQGTSSLIQSIAYSMTGTSLPQNIDAVETLAAGWINDMFDGTRTAGLYGSTRGSVMPVGNGWWPAWVLVLPYRSNVSQASTSYGVCSALVDCEDASPVPVAADQHRSAPARPVELV